MVWSYAIVKLFIGDLDRDLVAAVMPQIAWVLDLRFFVLLAFIALFLMLFKARTLGIGFAYVVGFPVVVIFWKLPAFLIKRRSKLAVLGAASVTGAIGVVYSLVLRSRTFLIALALWCTSGFVIALSGGTWLTLVGAGSMFVTLIWWLVVTSVDLLRTPRFVAAQEKLIKKILAWKVIENLITPEHPDVLELKNWKIEGRTKNIKIAPEELPRAAPALLLGIRLR